MLRRSGLIITSAHKVELDCRDAILDQFRENFSEWSGKLGPDHLLKLQTLGQISETSLTREVAIEMEAANLPNTFVPGRNLLFFTYAAALAYRRKIPALVGGMCETDYSGYPDCRNETLQTLKNAISMGMDQEYQIETPLMYIDKKGTWVLANELGGEKLNNIIREYTHTCYLGDRSTYHDWGYGCGTCPACQLRENGYKEWKADL